MEESNALKTQLESGDAELQSKKKLLDDGKLTIQDLEVQQSGLQVKLEPLRSEAQTNQYDSLEKEISQLQEQLRQIKSDLARRDVFIHRYVPPNEYEEISVTIDYLGKGKFSMQTVGLREKPVIVLFFGRGAPPRNSGSARFYIVLDKLTYRKTGLNNSWEAKVRLDRFDLKGAWYFSAGVWHHHHSKGIRVLYGHGSRLIIFNSSDHG